MGRSGLGTMQRSRTTSRTGTELMDSSATAGAEGKAGVMVAVTSDRGLCGGLNSNITKYTRALLKLDSASGA